MMAYGLTEKQAYNRQYRLLQKFKKRLHERDIYSYYVDRALYVLKSFKNGYGRIWISWSSMSNGETVGRVCTDPPDDKLLLEIIK